MYQGNRNDPYALYDLNSDGSASDFERVYQPGKPLDIVNVGAPLDLNPAVARAESLPPIFTEEKTVRITDAQQYGSISVIPFSITVAQGDRTVLLRPSTQRVHLHIQNQDTINSVFVNYGIAASSTSLELVAKANFFYDKFVPQDDVHIISPSGTVAVVVAYSNKGKDER